MDRLWGRRLGLVVAPAGSGKTTLLARFAGTAGAPVAWYRPESWDGTVEVFLGYLEAGRGDRAVVVVDDLHVLEGTPAEAAFERLLEYAPSLLFLAGSRTQPRLN